MRSHSRYPRYTAAAAALAAGAFVLAAGNASSTPNASGSASSTAYPSSSMTSSSSMPEPSSSMSGSGVTVTLHLYSVQEMSNLYTPNGTVVTNPSTAPTLGSYVVSTNTDYTGTQASHGSAVVATDHLYCLITKAPATGTCSAQIAMVDGSMLISDNSTQNLATSQNSTAPMTFPITSGTGRLAGAHGTVTVTPIANSSNANFTVTYSK